MKKFFATHGRALLALLGLAAIVVLVSKVGPDKVWASIVKAGPWLPVILVLDIGWMVVEGGGAYLLYGEKRQDITGLTWVRATLAQYAAFVVMPMSRAAGEVARAAALSGAVGKSRAAAVGVLMQAFTLTTNGILSVACLVVLILTTKHAALWAMLTFNVLATGGVGILLYLVLFHAKIGGFLGKRFARLREHGSELDAHVRGTRRYHPLCLGFCILGRLCQTVQYGIIFYAIVGDWSVSGALLSEGIQLVGRSMGDAVPNQVGVTEGAFALAAGAIGLAEHPEKAISLALLGRVSNLTVAGLCALGLQLLPRSRPSLEAPLNVQ